MIPKTKAHKIFLLIWVPSETMFGYVSEEIWILSKVFHKYSFRHVKREDNQLAHSFARRAVLSANLDIWVEDLPSELDAIFQADLVHL